MNNVEIDGIAMTDAVVGNPPTTRDTPPCRHCGHNTVRRPMHTLPRKQQLERMVKTQALMFNMKSRSGDLPPGMSKGQSAMSEDVFGKQPHYTILPPPPSHKFIDRGKVGGQIIVGLREGQPESASRRIFAVTGPDGIGKSDLCLRVAHYMQYYSATGRTDAAEMSRLLEAVEIQDTLVTPTQQTDKVSSLLQLGRVCRIRDPEAGVMNLFKEISAYRELEAKGKREQEPSQPWQVQCREDFYLTDLIQKAMEIFRLEPDTKDID